ncbi:ATP-dependent Clp protease ATP-binding subunit ClpA [Streptacidiphilus sp. MAP12-16]|uniref:Clp protease N-terminal domain-containing protein n=1 Tax=Streptacidiphilus sp. MAP12-16 TaxID=3156300 RepID=UPI0035177675
MFERFTDAARGTVEFAGTEARTLHHDCLGTEHLLLGLLHQPDEPAVAILVRAGLDLATARNAVQRLLSGRSLPDAAALEAIGIDLDAVTQRVEATFGAGALSRPGGRSAGGRTRTATKRIGFTGRAKKVMELSVRAMRGRGDDHIGTGHILLGLLREGGGLAVDVLRDHGLDLAEVERAVEAEAI